MTERVNTVLRTRVSFTAQEVMQLLNVGRMTITSWYQGEVFTVYKQRVAPKRDRGKGPREVLLIPAKELQAALEWKLPD